MIRLYFIQREAVNNLQGREEDLPECASHSVCNKVDTYDNPWIERQCRCPGNQRCSMSLESTDGHTITDKTRQFKVYLYYCIHSNLFFF